ncbi:putative nuclease HARBI1 [Pseudophryne corroboree]|uniref:putative nuclease HARBI1 n=1 Tax=Pseudophryne corroboree TaxID=495146 RepID=UPI003081708A
MMEPFSDQIVLFMLAASLMEEERADEHQDQGQQMSALGEPVLRVSFPRPRQYRTRRELEDLSEFEVIQNYRLSTRDIYSLYALLEADLEPRARSNRAISGFQKLLGTLHFLASGTFQPTLSQTCGFSQSTLSRCITQVIRAFRKLTIQYIKFPETDSECQEIKLGFYNKYKFPNVLGAIDCTHVQIRPPRNSEECFRNRKQFHSLNVQAVCDVNMRFLNIFVGFPGSSHDSFILSQSSLFDKFETGNMPGGWLLGDAGYPNKPWLLTPLSNPVGRAEKRYQEKHIASRGVIERAFGVLKSRFRCLDTSGGALLYSPSKVCGMVNACCILHNICVANRLPVTLRRSAFLRGERSSALPVGMDEGEDSRRTVIQKFFSVACEYTDNICIIV